MERMKTEKPPVQKTDMQQIKETALGMLKHFEVQENVLFGNHPFSEDGYFSEYDATARTYQYTKIEESPETRKRFIEQISSFIEAADEPGDILYLMSKKYQLLFLKVVLPYLSARDLGTCLADVWTTGINALKKTDIVHLFKMSDPETLMDDDERKTLAGLPDIVEVYRGVKTCGMRSARGMSWTLDLDRARWFAGRFDTKGYVFKATISKKDILAYLEDRQEAEAVVDTRKLMGVELLEEVEPKAGRSFVGQQHGQAS